MKRIAAVSILALTVVVGHAPTAAHAEGGVLRWIPLLNEFYNFADAGRKIATDDLPSVFSDSFDLQDTERRARRFHPRADGVEQPKIDGERVFSSDPQIRSLARREYADFVGMEERRIANMQKHRDRIAEQLSQMERRYESGMQMMRRLPDLIEMSSRIPVVNEVMPTDLAAAQLAGDENLRTLGSTIAEYRRIVAEFDRLIEAAKAAHDGHIQTLRTIDVIQGIVPANGAQLGPSLRPEQPGSPVPAPGPHLSLLDRIGQTVASKAGLSMGRAAALSNSLTFMRQRAAAMAPHGSGPRESTAMTEGRSEEPAWTGTMTLQR